MDISTDEVRRRLHEIDADHEATLAPTTELIDRLYQDDADTQTKWDVLAGGFNRATWVKVGGVAVLGSALIAACGSNNDSASPARAGGGDGGGAAPSTASGGSAAPVTTVEVKADAGDITLLKFSASIENLAVAAYAAAAPLLTNVTFKGLATLFAAHHKDHAGLFNGALAAAGEKPVTEPNPAYLAQFKPMLDALKTQDDVLRFAQTLELSAASTYFSTVGLLKGHKLGYTTMTIGGTEYRHAALLADVNGTKIDGATNPAFLTTNQALAPR